MWRKCSMAHRIRHNLVRGLRNNLRIDLSHLSKRSTYLKQNCHKKRHLFLAQFLYPFTWCDLFCCKCWLKKTPSGWMKFFTGQSEASNLWCSKLTLTTKRITPCERVWKSVPENGVFPVYNFVWGHLGVLQDVLSKLTNGDLGNLIVPYSNAIKLNFASVQFPKKSIVNNSTFKIGLCWCHQVHLGLIPMSKNELCLIPMSYNWVVPYSNTIKLRCA